MKLSELLTASRIRLPLEAATKDDVLRELVSLLGKSKDASDEILEAVLERERRMPTGIGRGIAIPHGKSRHVPALEVAFGVTRAPLDYGAIDREPVQLLFLLVSPPDQTGPHIRALAQISRMLSSDGAQDGLLAARTPADVLALIAREEPNLEE